MKVCSVAKVNCSPDVNGFEVYVENKPSFEMLCRKKFGKNKLILGDTGFEDCTLEKLENEYRDFLRDKVEANREMLEFEKEHCGVRVSELDESTQRRWITLNHDVSEWQYEVDAIRELWRRYSESECKQLDVFGLLGIKQLVFFWGWRNRRLEFLNSNPDYEYNEVSGWYLRVPYAVRYEMEDGRILWECKKTCELLVLSESAEACNEDERQRLERKFELDGTLKDSVLTEKLKKILNGGIGSSRLYECDGGRKSITKIVSGQVDGFW